jgi:hypothetical protein
MEQNLGYYQHGYSNGFELLYKAVIEAGGRQRHYFALPLFFIGRHSMELAIKEAIVAFATHSSETADLEGHRLAQLWTQLLRLIKAAGFQTDDQWICYCSKLVNHIHEADPDGECFRYPSNTKGVSFQFTSVELDGLAKAHMHISMFCDCSMQMLEASTDTGEGGELLLELKAVADKLGTGKGRKPAAAETQGAAE